MLSEDAAVANVREVRRSLELRSQGPHDTLPEDGCRHIRQAAHLRCLGLDGVKIPSRQLGE